MATTVATCVEEPIIVISNNNNNNSSRTSLEKIESFINEAAYKEALENSSNYNMRLNIERRLRLPFIDTQTGVAQNHSSLFMDRRQRIPGLLPGQIYSYPRQRWRKKRRQYLLMSARPFRADYLLNGSEGDIHNISQMENPALQDTDSKDSQLLKDDVPKDWYYDELEMDPYDDPDPDSDFDYEESYNSKRRRGRGRGGRGRGANTFDTPGTPGRKKGSGRGRAKKSGHNFETIPGDPDKPIVVERVPGRRGRPPNLPPNLPPRQASPLVEEPQMPVLIPEKGAVTTRTVETAENPGPSVPADSTKKGSSPYCDFCLGDSTENKKTGTQEELVSCSDCGRSGHPTCLQFTDNMKISVKTYRWQCIECKCCSVCGNSENDDQLLFCDDCDRGYHMYCLSPPLVNPPEGSWSCSVCIDKFHK